MLLKRRELGLEKKNKKSIDNILTWFIENRLTPCLFARK
jgi:hypothetical protein